MIQLIRERHTDLGSISGREKQSVEGDQSSGDRAVHPNEESSMAGTPRHGTRSRTLIPPLRLLLLWLIQGVDVLISALGGSLGAVDLIQLIRALLSPGNMGKFWDWGYFLAKHWEQNKHPIVY
jgi:hypothetical protein